jgi:hypothetical protein
LTGAGLASAVVCIVAPSRGEEWFIPGSVFGLASVTYLVLVECYRTPFRFIAFVCALGGASLRRQAAIFVVAVLIPPRNSAGFLGLASGSRCHDHHGRRIWPDRCRQRRQLACPMIDELDATKSQGGPIFIDRYLSDGTKTRLP